MDGRALAAASASRRERFRCASGRPWAQADDFECDGAIETFLMKARINNTLTTPADFI